MLFYKALVSHKEISFTSGYTNCYAPCDKIAAGIGTYVPGFTLITKTEFK